ncbi:MAG: hypothetical protein AAGI63_05875 [Planctomycetota bacterium]
MIGVGAWARTHYRAIHEEIHGNQGVHYGTLDQSYGGGGNPFSSWSSDDSFNQQTEYKPKEAVTSGVQANPYLD